MHDLPPQKIPQILLPSSRLRAAGFKGLKPPRIVAVSTKEEFVYFQFVSAGAVPVGSARDAITPSYSPCLRMVSCIRTFTEYLLYAYIRQHFLHITSPMECRGCRRRA